MSATAARRAVAVRTAVRTSAASAMIPPSPSLSARSTSVTYFTVTTTVTDQKISDTTPYTSSTVGCTAPSSIENTVCTA